MRIRVKIILALLIGTFCFTTYGVQAANVQASKEKMSGYGRSEKARKELKKRELEVLRDSLDMMIDL